MLYRATARWQQSYLQADWFPEHNPNALRTHLLRQLLQRMVEESRVEESRAGGSNALAGPRANAHRLLYALSQHTGPPSPAHVYLPPQPDGVDLTAHD
jgi:hypothetical protein